MKKSFKKGKKLKLKKKGKELLPGSKICSPGHYHRSFAWTDEHWYQRCFEIGGIAAQKEMDVQAAVFSCHHCGKK